MSIICKLKSILKYLLLVFVLLQLGSCRKVLILEGFSFMFVLLSINFMLIISLNSLDFVLLNSFGGNFLIGPISIVFFIDISDNLDLLEVAKYIVIKENQIIKYKIIILHSSFFSTFVILSSFFSTFVILSSFFSTFVILSSFLSIVVILSSFFFTYVILLSTLFPRLLILSFFFPTPIILIFLGIVILNSIISSLF